MTFLPFLDDFVPAIREGRKTRTARSKAYGMRGEVVDSPAGPLRLLSVVQVPLHIVRDGFWKSEGVESPEAFVEVWKQIHPSAGFNPDRMVFLHHFRPVERQAEQEKGGVA